MLDTHVLLHLSLIDGIGSATVATVLHNKPSSTPLVELYNLSVEQLMTHFGLSATIAYKLYTGLHNKDLLENELALLERHPVKWVTALCPNYPASLKNIAFVPPVLYYRGQELTQYGNSISVVGSRLADEYGERVIKSVLPTLVAHGLSIISGGALGIDSLAHWLTVSLGGKTAVVLGSGLLKPYPLQNKKLFEQVIDAGGSIISAFPLTFGPLAGNFPARNRIIAGLSKGCLVVQAAQKSGALITAGYALDQGKEVFAVPGDISNPLSAGCHKLLGQGAKLTTSALDILQEFGYQVPEQPEQAAKEAKVRLVKPLKDRARFKPVVTTTSEDVSPKGIIIANCQNPCSLDELLEKTGLDQEGLNTILFELQLEGIIEQNFMGMWQIA